MKNTQIKIDRTGTKRWYQNGKIHREDGPAVIFKSGTKHWYSNGQLHRIGGPAIQCADGHESWWIKGRKLSPEEYRTAIS